MPHLSVIIPTFNRAELLQIAIQSVLKQSYQDFELVISNGGSTDNTRQVVARYNDRRLIYVESSHRLTAAENYQQGLNAAKGKYITFLSDDDVYCPELLKTAFNTANEYDADIVGYRYARYYETPIKDFNCLIQANSLLVENHTSFTTCFSREEAIEQSLASAGLSSAKRSNAFIVPYLSNAIYRRDVFQELEKIRRTLFDFVPPDMYLALAVFFTAKNYVCLDIPLLVWRNWSGNFTATASRQTTDLKMHYKEKFQNRKFKYNPLKFPLPVTCGAECFLYALTDFEGNCDRVDWAEYFSTVYENLIFLESSGINVTDEIKEFERVLANQPPAVRRRVNSFRYSPMRWLKQFLSRRVPKLFSQIKFIIGRNQSPKITVFSGSEEGFSNILEAAEFLSSTRATGNR